MRKNPTNKSHPPNGASARPAQHTVGALATRPAEDASAGRGSPAAEGEHVVLARTALRDAAATAAAAGTRWQEAKDKVADAAAACRVAEAKAEEYGQDEKKAQWQRISAHEDTKKAQRDHARAVDAERASLREHEDAQAAVAEATWVLRTVRQMADDGSEDEGPRLRFASVEVFVRRYVEPNWRREVDRANHWCAQWWRHPEAVTRFEALWEAFEVMRAEPPPALSTWLRDHFDHHMTMLTRPGGTFDGCLATRHEQVHDPAARLQVEAAPAAMFVPESAADIQPADLDEPTAQMAGADGGR